MKSKKKPQAGRDSGLGQTRKEHFIYITINSLIYQCLIAVPADLWLTFIAVCAEVRL